MLTYSVKIFKELPTNKILSKHISSLNSKVEFCLNMGLVWRFPGWNSIILIGFFFVNSEFVEWCYDSELRQDNGRISSSQNSKIDES